MEQNVITVTKTVVEKHLADTACVALSAAGEAKKYADATDKADAAAVAVTAGLKRRGINARDGGMNVVAIRVDGKTSGYRAVRRYRFEFEASREKLGDVLELLSACDCEWSLSYSLKNSGGDELLARAVKLAERDAQAIAAAAGVKLGKLKSVEYVSSDGGRPMLMRAAACVDAEPEIIDLSETVACSWEIA